MRKYIAFYSIVIVVCSSAACGGGSSGGNDQFYGGIWRYQGLQVVNDCSLRLPGTVDHTHTVNQSAERVVLDSGQLVLQGLVDPEIDGFSVNLATQSNGCSAATAIVYDGASDGEASTGLAIVSRCGSLTCSTGWGGVAQRVAERTRASSNEPANLIDLQTAATPQAVLTRSNSTVDPLVATALSIARASLE